MEDAWEQTKINLLGGAIVSVFFISFVVFTGIFYFIGDYATIGLMGKTQAEADRIGFVFGFFSLYLYFYILHRIFK